MASLPRAPPGSPVAIESEEEFGALLASSHERAACCEVWAAWCLPCRRVAPTFARVAERFGDGITFARVNADKCRQVLVRRGIKAIPAFLLVRDGRVVATKVGVCDEDALVSLLERPGAEGESWNEALRRAASSARPAP